MTQSHYTQQPINIEPGTRIGLITVVRRAASLGTGARYLVRCDCGHERIVRGGDLRRYRFTRHQDCK